MPCVCRALHILAAAVLAISLRPPNGPTVQPSRSHRVSPLIIAVGDIHGDASGLLEVLAHAGVLRSSSSPGTPGPGEVGNPAGAGARSSFARCADGGVRGCEAWATAACRWAGGVERGATTLVQVGDVNDRGAHSLQAWACLRALQRSAPPGSAVVRLAGNHELLWLEGRFRFASRADTAARKRSLIRAIKDDVLGGAVVAAHAVAHALGGGGAGTAVLFTHAGIRPAMLELLVAEIQSARQQRRANDTAVTAAAAAAAAAATVTAFDLASHLNALLVEAVVACAPPPASGQHDAEAANGEPPNDEEPGPLCRLRHEIFSAGPDRRGRGIGGPFWTDFAVLSSAPTVTTTTSAPPSAHARRLRASTVQVVGHTAARCTAERDASCVPIRAAEGLTAIDIDAGMYRGGRAYLELEGRRATVRAKVGALRWADVDLVEIARGGGVQGGAGGAEGAVHGELAYKFPTARQRELNALPEEERRDEEALM